MMTAAQHLALADQLLAEADAIAPGIAAGPSAADLQEAIAHAVCAIAIELGVPIDAEIPEQEAPA